MTEYYNYSNFESDNLDKLAREINNKKTSLVKKVAEDFDIQQKSWKNNINTILNNEKYSFLPMNKNNVTNFDNYYESDNYDNNDNKSSYSFSTYQSSNSNDSKFSDSFLIDSEFIDSKSVDLYLDNAKNKNDKTFTNIVNSINYDECSRNDDNIFDHIKKCNNCKSKLLKYLNIGDTSNNSDEKNNFFDIKFNKLQKISIKEIVIIIMLGIFIIIILDMLVGKR